MLLGDLFTAYGSDKEWRHWLADAYTRETACWRDRAGALAEIGVRIPQLQNWRGGSLRAWCEWLPSFVIVGIDNNRHALEALAAHVPRVNVLHADQARPEEIAEGLRALAPAYDMIIDDGSHLPEHQIGCLAALWPLVKPGGLYVVEDMEGTGSDRGIFDRLAAMAHGQMTRVVRESKPPVASYAFVGDACVVRRLAYEARS